MTDTTTDTMSETILSMLKDMQRAISNQSALCVQTVKYCERIERRVDELGRRMDDTNRRIDDGSQRTMELKDDLALMLKAELLGSFANFETRFEHRLDSRLERIDDRLENLERRLPA